MPFRHARAAVLLMIGHVARFLHIRFLVTSLRLRGSLHVIFLYLVPLLPHDIDCSGVERCLDMRCIIFLDHLDTRAPVLSDLVDVGTLPQA